MTTITENLNKIWSEFRKVGITDDLVVIEYLARLLLEEVLDISESNIGIHFDGMLPTYYQVMGFLPTIDAVTNLVPISTLPRHPKDICNVESIKENLENAINKAESIPNLFNHHILFRLLNRLPGGRYPTPRHITKFIYNLVQIEPHHSLADFACGSGGFLVERELTIDNYHKTWGIDISPEWIRLAYANIALRKFPPQLRSGNALEVATFKQTEYNTFDRILMAPSFGEKIDSKLANEKLKKNVGSRSETALTTLAIQKLADDGIAAILVPSGLLFSNSKAERELRQTLIDDYHLKAVITLPKDALQPYSSLQSHILLIHKQNPPQPPLEKMTWFFQLEEDGYPSGRSRDLTEPPKLYSDFPFVESVFKRQGDEFDYSFPESNPQLGVKVIEDDENKLLGFVFEGIETEILLVTFFPQLDDTNPSFLVVDRTSTEEQKLCIKIKIPLNGSQPTVVENWSKLIEDYLKLNKEYKTLENRILVQAVPSVAIAVSPDTIITKESFRILGVAIRHHHIINQNYDLRPEEYIYKQSETRLNNSPVELLTRLYTNQKQLTQNLETLFSRIELPPISTQKLPSPIEKTFTPFGQLNPQQQAIWDKIQRKTQPYTNNDGENYEIALHFTPQDIESEDNEDISDTTQRTLELLEAMGVIIPVTIHHKLYYRRVTQRDLWTNSD